MQRLTMAQETIASDLRQRSLDAMFDAQFPENGSFVRRTAAGRDYYYYVGYRKAADGGAPGKQFSKYVGPADDPVIGEQVASFGSIKASYKERRDLVRALRGTGLATPPRFVGEVVEALWKAGVFRLRGVLVGTAAFQTYEASMGVRFPTAPTMTGDVDIAQFRSISFAVRDRTEPLLDALKAIDPSFAPVPHQMHRMRSVAFKNGKDFRVEFLSPHVGSPDHARDPHELPSMAEASGQPLRFLDYLIHRPERSVVLHGGGVPVLVPAPDRYCIHKMIVSRRRPEKSIDKARKDLLQASLLLEAAAETSVLPDFGHAWIEAWTRAPKWRADLVTAEDRLAAPVRRALTEGREAAARQVGRDVDGLRREIADARARANSARIRPRGREDHDGVGI